MSETRRNSTCSFAKDGCRRRRQLHGGVREVRQTTAGAPCDFRRGTCHDICKHDSYATVCVCLTLSLSLSCVVRLVLCVFVTDLQYSIYYITLTYHVTTLHSVLCYSILDNTILDYTSLCLLIPSCSVVSYDSILYSAIYTTFLALHTFVSPFSYIPL